LVFSLLYNLGFRVIIMCAILAYYKSFVFLHVLFFVFASVLIIVPGISIGFFLAAFGPFREDIKRFISLISRPLMFLSCTIFPMPPSGVLSYVNFLNPAAVFINNIRYIAVHGNFYNFEALIIWLIGFCVFFLFAWKLFKFAIKYLMERS